MGAIVFPFIPFGQVASKVWGGPMPLYALGYAVMWVAMIVLCCLGSADMAFASMGASMYFVNALGVAGLRAAVRTKLGITGDMISDAMACTFAFPWAIGQMVAEDFDDIKGVDDANVIGAKSVDDDGVKNHGKEDV